MQRPSILIPCILSINRRLILSTGGTPIAIGLIPREGGKKKEGFDVEIVPMNTEVVGVEIVGRCVSLLWANKGSAPQSNVGVRQQQTRTQLVEGRE